MAAESNTGPHAGRGRISRTKRSRLWLVPALTAVAFLVMFWGLLFWTGHIVGLAILTTALATGMALSMWALRWNIDRRREVEEEARQNEVRYRRLVEDQPALLCRFLPDGTLTYVNRAYADYFGRSVDDLTGFNFYRLIPENDREAAQRNIAALGPGNLIDRNLHRVLTPTGEIRWQEWINRAFVDEEGRVVEFQAIGQDITNRVRAEEERREFETRFRHAQKLESLGVLAGGIAHDFNNLLMAILGNADLALMAVSLPAPARRSIEEIKKAAIRASGLTNQMLAYSGKGQLVVKPLDLNRLVEDMGNLLKVSISKKVQLRYDLHPELPAVEVDASQINQVVMNLITNAAEAVGDQTGRVTLRTYLIEADRQILDRTYLREPLPAGPYVCLEVTDTGCGMSEATQARIFDPFFTTKFTGRGLGLAAVLGIVRGHGGAIEVSSEVDKGSSFRIFLPVSDRPTEQATPPDSADLDTWRGHGTILVVDDEESVRQVASSMLSRLGFSVLTAADGIDGVETFRARANEIDLVILDMTMPRLDGPDTLRELRRIRPDVAVLLCSGYTEQIAAEQLSEAGVAGFLQKPFLLDRLASKLREVCDD